jgi:hypothetical protein
MRTNGYLGWPSSTFAAAGSSPNIPSVSAGCLSGKPISLLKGGKSMQSTTVESTETIEAVRFLWAMVGVSAGVVELVDYQMGTAGERVTCRNRTTKSVFTVSRSRKWTEAEEIFYAGELDRALSGDVEADPVAELSIAQDGPLVASVR